MSISQFDLQQMLARLAQNKIRQPADLTQSLATVEQACETKLH